ncbi:MAG: hypothetical protein AABO57_24455 [Acidobacteriota bacterium]
MTNDPSSKVVKLRDELISLAEGKIAEIRDELEPEERYVLLYGYGRPLRSLAIPPALLTKLEDIAPPRDYEVYVLVHTEGDDILEYTRWEPVNENWHPGLSPMPLLITGKRYRISMGLNKEVTVETER